MTARAPRGAGVPGGGQPATQRPGPGAACAPGRRAPGGAVPAAASSSGRARPADDWGGGSPAARSAGAGPAGARLGRGLARALLLQCSSRRPASATMPLS